MAGFVIQATGKVEFEVGLLIGNQLKAQNGLQRVCTKPVLNKEKFEHPDSSRDRLNSNVMKSAWPTGFKPGTRFDSQWSLC